MSRALRGVRARASSDLCGKDPAVSDRSQLKFALAAAVAGLAWGFVRHRRAMHPGALTLLQALEWFVAYGGAAALLALLRQFVESSAEMMADEEERITHFRQVVTERTGTDG
jgi:hypothetical protein